MDVPRISVIMTVYNTAHYVKLAIESILNQTFTDFEFLIFNDGSTDDSANIIKSIKDDRILFFDDQQNTGYVKRVNKAIEIAKGDFIARMDSDDIALPERFAKQIEFMTTHPQIGICGSSFVAFGDFDFVENLPICDSDIREMMLVNNPMAQSAVMIRKDVIDNYNLRYKHSSVPVEDYFLWYDISKVTQLHNLPDILLMYRRHASQISVVMNDRQRMKVNELRITQLIDKGFIMSEEDKKIYCAIVDNSIQENDTHDFIAIINVMQKITMQNKEILAYRSEVFKKIFSVSWNRLVREVRLRNPKYISYVLGANNYVFSTLTVVEKIKFVLKSLVF